MKLKLDQIGVLPKYYPRVNGQADWLTVHRYADGLKSDPKLEFPDIHVVKALGLKGFDFPYLLIDGAHRTRSYLAAGREFIPAVVEHLPQSKWLARSVELNATHGRPLDTGDKAWIAERLEEEGYSEQQTATLLCMSVGALQKIRASRVVKIRAEHAKVIPVGRSNRKMNRGSLGFLKAPLIGANGSRSVVAALQSQGSVASHDVPDVLDSFIAVLRAGVVNVANEEIAAKVSIIRELLEKV